MCRTVFWWSTDSAAADDPSWESWELQQLPAHDTRAIHEMMQPGLLRCCVLNANGSQAFRVKLLHTTDSHSPPRSDNPNMRYLRGARKKTKGAPTSVRRHSRVIDLRRHAARTATAVERATAHVHSHVRGCRWVISPHTTHARAQARPMATPVERGVSE